MSAGFMVAFGATIGVGFGLVVVCAAAIAVTFVVALVRVLNQSRKR